MKCYWIAFLWCLLTPIFSFAQLKTDAIFIIDGSGSPSISADGKSLVVFESNYNTREKWAKILNLENFTWQGKPSIVLNTNPNSVLSPNFDHAFGNVENQNGHNGSSEWIKFKKFLTWYYPDRSDKSNKKQWADQFFILAERKDGTLLVASELIIPKTKSEISAVFIKSFGVFDPKSEQLLRTLYTFPKGSELRMPDDWRQPRISLIQDEELLYWSDSGLFTVTVNLKNGKVNKYPARLSYYGLLDGGLGVGHTYGEGSSYNRNIRQRMVFDVETGAKITEDRVFIHTDQLAFNAVSGKNLYTLNSKTNYLLRERWNGEKFELVDSIKLAVGDVFDQGIWPQRIYAHLFVSESLNRVILCPTAWAQNNSKDANQLLCWDLKSGALIFIGSDFMRTSSSQLARMNQPKLDKLPFNALVKNNAGEYYVLLKFDDQKRNWSVLKFNRNKFGNYDKEPQLKEAAAFAPAYTTVVSSTNCAKCAGSGNMKVIKTMTNEKVDKMIYTKITTTTTKDVLSEAVCSDCKGLGFTLP